MGERPTDEEQAIGAEVGLKSSDTDHLLSDCSRSTRSPLCHPVIHLDPQDIPGDPDNIPDDPDNIPNDPDDIPSDP